MHTRLSRVKQLALPWSCDTSHTLIRYKLRHLTRVTAISKIPQHRDKLLAQIFIDSKAIRAVGTVSAEMIETRLRRSQSSQAFF
jgi:hypothetical protein